LDANRIKEHAVVRLDLELRMHKQKTGVTEQIANIVSG